MTIAAKKRGRPPGIHTGFKDKNRERGQAALILSPTACAQLYGKSVVTINNWERAGWLPARDAFVGGRAVGWLRETILAAMRGETAPQGRRRA